MRKIVLSDEEIQELVNLMDAAVKHLGLSVAGNASILFAKLQAAEEIDAIDPKSTKNAKK